MPTDAWKQTLLAPDFTVADWYAVRDQLDPDRYDRRWQRVIGRIRMRLRRRFLDPADALIRRDKRFRRIADGPGFAVLAIDCILIETLFGYERGAHVGRRNGSRVHHVPYGHAWLRGGLRQR